MKLYAVEASLTDEELARGNEESKLDLVKARMINTMQRHLARYVPKIVKDRYDTRAFAQHYRAEVYLFNKEEIEALNRLLDVIGNGGDVNDAAADFKKKLYANTS